MVQRRQGATAPSRNGDRKRWPQLVYKMEKTPVHSSIVRHLDDAGAEGSRGEKPRGRRTQIRYLTRERKNSKPQN